MNGSLPINLKMNGRSACGFLQCLAIHIASGTTCCVNINILCNRQGKGDMKAHCKTTGHQQKVMALEKQPRLSDLLPDQTKPS